MWSWTTSWHVIPCLAWLHMTPTLTMPAICSPQRDYIKELEDMKRELEQYMASVRALCN